VPPQKDGTSAGRGNVTVSAPGAIGKTLDPDVRAEPLEVDAEVPLLDSDEVVPLLDSDAVVPLLEQAAVDVTHAAAVTPTATAAKLR